MDTSNSLSVIGQPVTREGGWSGKNQYEEGKMGEKQSERLINTRVGTNEARMREEADNVLWIRDFI